MNDLGRTIAVVALGLIIGVTTFLSFGWPGAIGIAVAIVLIGKFYIMRSKFYVTLLIAGAMILGAYIVESMGWTLMSGG